MKKLRLIARIFLFIILIFLLAIVSVVVLLGIVMYFNKPPKEPLYISDEALEQDSIKRKTSNEYFLDVRKGETAQSLGLRLERAGLIRNRTFWYLLFRFSGQTAKTGTYLIETPITQMAIKKILISGNQVLYRITIPEGVTLKKIASILKDAGICSEEDFFAAAGNSDIIKNYGIPNKTMEGYLFPDTYLFPFDYPAELVIKSMADNFFTQVYTFTQQLTAKELNDLVILASIVEREYRIQQEAPLMAGVFLNRLRIGMPLQSCATVEYIITEIQGRPHPKVLFNIDIEINHPYNTYRMAGLPPGPISAPGKIALEAVINPTKSEYLFFRLTDAASGKHYFSRTYDEHIRAGQLFTKGNP
jgi:UPF0755 protein